MGDGTYYHTGLLAIRAAVAAQVNITYKILYNDAVAMTGGQPVDGPLSVSEIDWQVRHEGVRSIVLLSDNPGHHLRDKTFPRSEEHTSELQSLMRISYAVFCLKKKRDISTAHKTQYNNTEIISLTIITPRT